jgi:hypothetical protein
MGQFAVLRLGKLTITIEKNHLYLNHSCLFTKEDLKQIPYYCDTDSTETKKGFQSNFNKVIARLELLGYTKETAKNKFDDHKIDYLSKYSETILDINFYDLCNLSTSIDVNFDLSLEILYNTKNEPCTLFLSEYSDFAKWYLFIINNKKLVIEKSENINTDILDFLSEIDPYVILVILSNNKNIMTEDIFWEYMDLVEGGYINDDVYEENAFDKYLIVTEGSSDTNILKVAFNKLKPSIYHFFEFIDMRENYPFTGTGNLVNFYFGLCKINKLKRIIFIFDNDAEGILSARKCNHNSKYMKVMNLPSLEEFANINCLGPEGEHESNINEKAVSIEMFLDLNYKNDTKPQIRWVSFNPKSHFYQGALINKEKYVRLFFEGIDDEAYNKDKLNILLDRIIELATSFRDI